MEVKNAMKFFITQTKYNTRQQRKLGNHNLSNNISIFKDLEKEI